MDLQQTLIELSNNASNDSVPKSPASLPYLPPSRPTPLTTLSNHLFPRFSTKLSISQSGSTDLLSSVSTNEVTRINAQRASNYNITHDSIHKTLEKLKIALTFLLHDKSPIWQQHNKQSDVQSSFATNPTIRLRKRYQEYTVRGSMIGGDHFPTYELVLNSLFDKQHKHHYNSLFSLWSQWISSAKDVSEKSEKSNHKNVDICGVIENNQQILEEDCSDFIHTINVSKQYGDSSLTALNNASSEALKNVKTRKEMKQWINKYKSHHHLNQKCCANWFKGASYKSEKKNFRIFIDLWSWQNVVAAMEDAVYINTEGDEFRLKHFASVFWQFQINGKELLAMNATQIQFLVECWCLNNIQDQLFAAAKLESHFRSEAEYVKMYVDKLRIRSHCVARYYLSMDIIDWIIYNTEHNADKTIDLMPYYEDAVNIKCCIDSLRSKVDDGPNKYWKPDAYFFNKIDNYLSVLICDETIREIYKCFFPDFLYQDTNANAPLNKNNIQHSIASLSTEPKKRSNIVPLRKKTHSQFEEEDALDLCTDKCCNHDICFTISCIDDYRECVHNLDRFYLKVACVMMMALILGCVSIILYYYRSGMDQANDAMFLSLEAIGDRASHIMTHEFWVPQIFTSLTIGGLTTGDLLPNASLYTYPHCKFDEFFAEFTTASHTDAIFSIFMYNEELNTVIGARRLPDFNESDTDDYYGVDIFDFNGSCRHFYRYNSSLNMRDIHDSNKYIDCYNPRTKAWYLFAQKIGFGRAQWTEPYVFRDDRFHGMAYVAPVIWKGHHLIFVVEVTTYTLAVAVSQEVQHLPQGSLWMIVTPGNNAVASSNNETLIHVAGCEDGSNDSKIIAAIEWMQDNDIEEQEHFSLLRIDDETTYEISIYSFEINHVNLYPPQPYTQSNEYIVKSLRLNNESDYQYGYVVIVNDDTYLQQLYYAWWLAICLSLLSFLCVVTWLACNIRHHNIEQHHLGREGRSRSKLIRATHSKRVQIAKSNINLFQQLSHLSADQTHMHKMKVPQVGHRLKTKDNQYGVVQFIGDLSKDTNTTYFGLELEHNHGSILVNIDDIVYNFGSYDDMDMKQESGTEHTQSNTRLLSILSSPTIKEDESDTNLSHIPSIRMSTRFTGSYIASDSDSDNEYEQDINNNKKSKCDWFAPCCYISQKSLRCVLFLCVFIALSGIIAIWETMTTNATMTLFDDVMAKHEWLTIQDEAYILHDFSEIITDVIRDRFYRKDMNLSNYKSLNLFLINTMQSFVAATTAYYPWIVYIATPNGNIHGIKYATLANVSTLQALRRDKSTNYSYNWYTINDATGDVILDDLQYSNRIYDPRCRSWYISALYYSFRGSLQQAFPNDTYKTWLLDTTSPTASVTNCKDMQNILNGMFVAGNISQYDEWSQNEWQYIGAQSNLVWNRHLFTIDQIGLTASTTIIDPDTGELLAILAVDYRLQSLSNYLHSTVFNTHDNGQTNVKYNKWKAWIFESNDDHAMIASSDGHNAVLHEATETEGCYGTLVATENEKVPYLADQHPQTLIRVYSKEVIDVSGLNVLQINATLPEQIRVPRKMPTMEAGRVLFYPQGSATVDWVIIKVMDVSSCFVDDFFISEVILVGIVICVWVVLRNIGYTDKQSNDVTLERNICMDRNDYISIMNKMKPLIQSAANTVWAKSMKKTLIITTEDAQKFLANRANEHITASNENNNVFRECAWIAASDGHTFKFHFWWFIESYYYDIPIQVCLIAHLAATFWEPDTPKQLAQTGANGELVIILSVFQLIQWIDCILIGMKRYFEYDLKEPYLTCLFELNYGKDHKYTRRKNKFKHDHRRRALYLTLTGPQCRRYLLQLLFVLMDFINFILMVFVKIAPFSYYLPILPLLIMVRNQHVLFFGYDLFSAIYRAKGVLFSYFCFIILLTIFTMTLFRDTVNYNEFADSFQTLRSAFIAAFVFITTQENYSLIYDVFHSNYYTKSYAFVLLHIVLILLCFAMMGMFYWVPMIIDQFEQYFEESNMRKHEKNEKRKTNAIIASFIMLDFDKNCDIDRKEFEYLITFSDLVDKNKLFVEMDDNNNNSLDVYEYVECLLAQSFRPKIIETSSAFYNISSSKCAAFLECNIFRSRSYTMYVFVFLTAPVIALSCAKGLNSGFDVQIINYVIGILFILNMIEIHCRMFCFGIGRFWDLLKYPNPRYVIAAINNYNKYQLHVQPMINVHNDFDFNVERLTSAQREYVSHYLHDTRPWSILEKSTQTLVNRIEIIAFWVALALFIVLKLFSKNMDTDDSMFGPHEDITRNVIQDRYIMHFLQSAVIIRLFTLIPSNQKSLYILFVVAPKFMSLFAFLSLYLYLWARIGCALFGDNKSDIVITDIYDVADSVVTNFNSLPYAILSLIQMLIGDGWQDIMYYNIIATSDAHYVYFIIYFTIVSLISTNVFVGLFLADIDDYTQQQSYDELMQNSVDVKSKKFQLHVNKKINSLKYTIESNKSQNELIKQQIENLQLVLQSNEM